MKTKGHYHLKNPAGLGYPELYEVIEGVAHVLLQKKTLDYVVLVKATNGDIVLIPPDYGHLTINLFTGRDSHDGQSHINRVCQRVGILRDKTWRCIV